MTIDCHEVERLLSSYYDGELDRPSVATVEHHLAVCRECRSELRRFEDLSSLVREDDRQGLVPPPQLDWNTFARHLRDSKSYPAVEPANRRSGLLDPVAVSPRWRPAIIAASFLLAVGLSAWWSLSGPRATPGETNLEAFVRQFIRDPETAQMRLLAQYRGEPIRTTAVARHLGLPIPTRPSAGEPFRLVSLHKLRMPCCDCVEAVCTRNDGTKIAVFGHNCAARVRLGNGKSQQVRCDGKICQLIELPESRFAAKWQVGNVRLLVVGARNKAEIERLVEWLRPDLPSSDS